MTSPTVCTTHQFGDCYVLLVFLPSDNVIQQMPVFGAKMHPCCHVTMGQPEDQVGDKEIVFIASFKQQEDVANAFAYSVSSPNTFPRCVVGADPCAEVTK